MGQQKIVALKAYKGPYFLGEMQIQEKNIKL